ncbi:MAG: tyrosine-protein phosphatase [Coprococcus sp.]
MGIYHIERIPLEGPQNVRDLGGFAMEDGRYIKEGKLIRSCELIRLTERDKDILLKDHHLHTIVDFRTELEKSQMPDPELQGVASFWIPVLDESMLGITKEAGADQDTVAQLSFQIKTGQLTTESFMKKLYRDIVLSEHAARAYHRFFEVLLNEKEGAVLWHCSAGKDRAGMAAMLVLTALGAPRELIIEDYLMVNIFLKENIEYNRQRIIEKTGDVYLADSMMGLFSVERSYAEYAFSVMEERCGSAEGYLEQIIGVTQEDCRKLRRMYLTE